MMSRVEHEWGCICERAEERLGTPLPPIDIMWSEMVGFKPRHFADAGDGLVRIHPDLELQGIATIRGVLAHELGHCLNGFVDVSERDPERRADMLAEMATGWRIVYGPDLVQRAGPGARGTWPRPRGLW